MNTLVVYDTQFGTTEEVARTIAETLRSYGQVQTVRVEHTHPLYLDGVDLLILGCPTQKWNATPETLSLLDYIPPTSLSRLAVACFDTRLDQPQRLTGSAAERMVKKLSKKNVARLLPSESFLVRGMHGPLKDGELERAVIWA
ncbi:MAG TPA: flavodoxin domain-containing protein, partial [Ktedonobacteraceae bacterium]|nr:flavodoxin domain-containing protein [Ktedonobacteraceae bacterium]